MKFQQEAKQKADLMHRLTKQLTEMEDTSHQKVQE